MIWDDLIDENFCLNFQSSVPRTSAVRLWRQTRTMIHWRQLAILATHDLTRHAQTPGIVGELGDIMSNSYLLRIGITELFNMKHEETS